MPTIEPKPGDRIWVDASGEVHFRRPTRWELFIEVLELPFRCLIGFLIAFARALYLLVKP